MRNLLALLFLSFCLASHSQSLVDSIHVTLTSFCGNLDVEVTGWYNGSDPAYLGHAIWGGYAPISLDGGFEIQPGYFNVSLSTAIEILDWFPIYGSGDCGGFQTTCFEELGLVLASGPDWWWYCPEESPSEVLWSFDYSPMILGTQLGLDENGNPIDLNTTDLGPPCGPGTVWDSSLELCVPDNSFPLAPCGGGTVWDPVNEECIIAVPTDSDFDGCVTPSDLLNLLATFGTCPPYPEWPDGPTDTTWICGDPVTYWDYDYATVLIGDQCWFAENLATTRYTDGTVIDSGLSNSGWASTTTGAQSAYNDDDAVVSTHGRLYNGYAVDDTRGLCPTNWSVPTDSDFIHLEENLGMPTEEAISLFWRGSDEGQRLKSTTWQNGLDEVGFSALPCGGRNHSSGNFLDDGAIGYWWTQTFNIDGLFYRRMDSTEDRIFRTYPSMNYGFSVRCIQD